MKKQIYDLKDVSKEELFELLDAAIDGIDGYESEADFLEEFWNVSKIERARTLIDEVKGRSGIPPAYSIPESVVSDLSELGVDVSEFDLAESCIPKQR